MLTTRQRFDILDERGSSNLCDHLDQVDRLRIQVRCVVSLVCRKTACTRIDVHEQERQKITFRIEYADALPG
jgi:hypothetical protein